MRRILMRGAMNPIKNNDPYKVLIKDLIGTNTGNMIFLNSVYRTLLVEDTVIDTIKISDKVFTKKEISKINKKYDCFVMPLANAFRETFIDELNALTALIKQLEIPCYVIGIGVQATLDQDIESFYPYKKEAKAFVDAVLEKSNIIGVRGQSTADFLTSLGYKQEKDFTVIGCPSMYTYGENLPDFSNVKIDVNSKIAINSKPLYESNHEIKKFFKRIAKRYTNFKYFPQHIGDIRRIFFGNGIGKSRKHKFYEDKNAVAFTNMQKWLEYLKDYDISVGTRIHGSIAAIISGIPAVIIPPDVRVLELVKYHSLPHIPIEQFSGNLNFKKAVSEIDFNCIHNGHKERFRHYIEFLDKNGLDHIFKHEYKDGVVPFDRIVNKSIKNTAILTPFDACSAKEQKRRLKKYKCFEKVKKIHSLFR